MSTFGSSIEQFIKSDAIQKAIEFVSQQPFDSVELKNENVLKRIKQRIEDFAETKAIVKKYAFEKPKSIGKMQINIELSGQYIKNQTIAPITRLNDLDEISQDGNYILCFAIPSFPNMTENNREDWIVYWGIENLFMFQQPENPTLQGLTKDNNVETVALFASGIVEDQAFPHLLRFRPLRISSEVDQKGKTAYILKNSFFGSETTDAPDFTVAYPKKLLQSVYQSFL